MRKLYPLALTLLVLLSCENQNNQIKNETSENEAIEISHNLIAKKIIDQASPSNQENILLVGGETMPEIIPALKAEIESAGAIYLGLVTNDSTLQRLYESEFVNELESIDDSTEYEQFLAQVDLGLMLPGAVPSDKVYGDIQDLLWEAGSPNSIRTIHFHWEGAYNLDGSVKEVGIDESVFYQNAVLNTDYESLARTQDSFEEAMRGSTIRVTTPGGTDISFEIGDRPVTKQDGNASADRMRSARNLIDREIEIPPGAVRVAPIESTVNGVIRFPDGPWGGIEVRGLVMEFQNGRLTSFEAEEGVEGVEMVLEAAGDAGRAFREFALGMNPQLAIPEDNPWIPYYAYGAGLVRLSLGDNSELGGEVTGGFVRWNFFTDATVTVGDDVWVENGKLLK